MVVGRHEPIYQNLGRDSAQSSTIQLAESEGNGQARLLIRRYRNKLEPLSCWVCYFLTVWIRVKLARNGGRSKRGGNNVYATMYLDEDGRRCEMSRGWYLGVCEQSTQGAWLGLIAFYVW